MARIGDLRISVRLAALAATPLVLLAGIVGVGLAGIRGQQRDATVMHEQQVATRLAMQVKFRSADFNGWQTAYAFDIVRGVRGAAADSAPSRSAFLASTQAFRTELAAVAALPLNEDERRLVDAIGRQFDQFMALDATIVEGYRGGRPDQVRRATGLVMDQEITIFNSMAAQVDQLVAALDRDAAATDRTTQGAAAHAQRLMLVGALLALLCGIGLAWLVGSSITRPVNALRRRLADIADGDGDLTQRLPDTGRDELGQVAAAFNRFAARVQDLLVKVAGTGERVEAAAGELTTVGGQLAENAAGTDERAASAAAAAEQISRSVETVSAGAEEMVASIGEIAQSASEAARVSQQAVGATRDADLVVTRLGESSAKIDTVLRLIGAVADQTNLLALNATIEAARAGEAGRGFAVVAAEVKQLAQETARATEDISGRIAAIQGDTQAAVAAIGQIATVIETVSGYSTTIAAATEEQSATTAEMTRSITEAATGSGVVAANVTDVAESAQAASAAAGRAQRTATELGAAAADLRDLLGSFRY
jgi:methyl-accepting chemotaxis protein